MAPRRRLVWNVAEGLRSRPNVVSMRCLVSLPLSEVRDPGLPPLLFRVRRLLDCLVRGFIIYKDIYIKIGWKNITHICPIILIQKKYTTMILLGDLC